MQSGSSRLAPTLKVSLLSNRLVKMIPVPYSDHVVFEYTFNTRPPFT